MKNKSTKKKCAIFPIKTTALHNKEAVQPREKKEEQSNVKGNSLLVI